MADNSQTTDPMSAVNDPENAESPRDDAMRGVPPAEDSYPDLVRDPGKGNVPAGTPLARGSQASDF